MCREHKDVPDIGALLPAGVREVLASLRAAGAAAYIVGGAVRDALLGDVPADWDLATALPPDRLVALFPDASERDLRLGVVRIARDGYGIVVTSLREESSYTDHRHPDVVRFITDAARDARRRDFTVNALYWDPDTGAVLDFVDGRRDLREGRLRTIGDPVARLTEDPLRMLRCVRFAARCKLTVDPETAAAVRAHAALVHRISAERVLAELTLAFTGRGRGRALRLLVDLGLAAQVLPEVVAMDGVPQPPEFHPEGDVLTHTCMVLDHVRAGDEVQAWSAVLHDIGKPATFDRSMDRIRFSGHDRLSARMAVAVLERLHARRDLIDAVEDVCAQHIRFASLLQMKPGKRERWMRSELFRAHLDFHRADCLASHGNLSIHDAAVRLLDDLPVQPPEPLCTGKDVLALGVPEGPAVGQILRELEERLDELEQPDRKAALDLLETIVRARGQGPATAGR